MKDFEIRQIVSNDIEKELKRVGFDACYSKIASEKFNYKNLKIYDLTSAQANIIKQTALSVGADCGTHHNVITGDIEKSDVILGGSYAQLRLISKKLQMQPFSLKNLSDKINAMLTLPRRKTKLAGILNVTPDSFSDGGKYIAPKEACTHIMEMVQEGADMIDIGAETTKPYSNPVDPKEQIKRLKPILKFIQNEKINVTISVDTRSSEVADYALNNGVHIINDVSGFEFDTKLPLVVSKYNSGVIIQHSKGSPENMQENPFYDDVIEEIYKSLNSKIEYAKSIGINHIIADPGIGFGKTKEHNLEILNRIEELFSLDVPLMVGVSRKSFLGIKEENNDLRDALTLAVSYPLIQKGVDYLRVHNVKLHKNILRLGSE